MSLTCPKSCNLPQKETQETSLEALGSMVLDMGNEAQLGSLM